MVITYYGASCFKVQSGETVLVFSPPSKTSSYKSPRFQANVVLINNNDKDYNGSENISGKGEAESPLIVDGPGEYEMQGIYIKGVGSPSSEGGAINTVYSVDFEGISICHLGGFKDKSLGSEIKETVGKVDILFVPIGGKDVTGPQEAAKIATQTEAKIIIPMHYDDDKTLKKFVDEFGGDKVKPADKLTVKKKDVAEKKGEIVVLQSG